MYVCMYVALCSVRRCAWGLVRCMYTLLEGEGELIVHLRVKFLVAMPIDGQLTPSEPENGPEKANYIITVLLPCD